MVSGRSLWKGMARTTASVDRMELQMSSTSGAREEADPAAGAVVGVGFFGFTTTFFSGALR